MNPTSTPDPTRKRGGSGFFRGLAAALATFLVLGLVATVVSAQTGGDDGDGDEGTTEETPDVDREAFEAFRECLTENGVEVPADGERPNRDDITDEQREAFRTAREACADELPEGARFGGGPGGHGPHGFGGPDSGGAGEQPAGFGGVPADGLTAA